MNASIVVTLITGKVWAVSPEGEKRELKVGDTLLGNETLIVSDDAQVELDYGNNQVINFIGEQTTNVLNASKAAIESTPPEFNPIIDDTNDSNVQENTVLIHEGHNFVQLVRIGEIIEADGINYLSVARIAEVIQSLTLNLPNRLVDPDEEIEAAGGDSNTFEANGDSLVTLDDSSVYEGNDITITASVNNAPVINDLILTLNNGEIITIAVGETTGSVTFANPNSEDPYVDGEVTEYSIVSANGGKYQTLDISSTSTVTIFDTENTSTVSLNNPTVTEGEDITLTATVDNAPQKAPLILMLSNGEIITIAVGETAGSVTFSNANDDDSYIDNSIENISISSSTGGNYELLDISATSTITVADTVEATTISLDNPRVEEGTDITITASVDNAPIDSSLIVTLDNGEVITIAVGEMTGSVTFTNPNTEDAYIDGGDLVYSISDATGGNYEDINSDATSTVTVTDTIDTSKVVLSSNAVEEGTDITITATVDNAPEETDLVLTLNNGAQITIAAGDTTNSVTFANPNGEDVYVDGETLEYSIISTNNGGNYEVLDTRSITTVAVTNTSTEAVVSLSDSTVAEGSEITITATVTDAPQGDDLYLVLSNNQTIIIEAGQTTGSATFTNPNTEDTYLDTNTQQVVITSSMGGNYETLNIKGTASTITVTDTNDTVTATLSVSTDAINEGNSDLMYTVTLTDANGVSTTANNNIVVETTLGSITIEASKSSGTLNVPVQNDDVYLDKEIIKNEIIGLTETNEGTAGALEDLVYDATPVETVVSDTVDTVKATLSVNAAEVNEGSDDLVYTVVLTDQDGQTVTANNAVVVVTELGNITIAAGSSSGTLDVAVQSDDIYIDGEKIENAIIGVAEENAGAENTFEKVIFDNTVVSTTVADTEDTVTAILSVSEDAVTEGSVDNLVYTVVLTDSSDINVTAHNTVTVETSLGSITIQQGGSFGTLIVPVQGDDVYIDGEKIENAITGVAEDNAGAENAFEKIIFDNTVVSTTVADTEDTVTAILSVSEDAVTEGSVDNLVYTVVLTDSSDNNVTTHNTVTVETSLGTIIIQQGDSFGTLIVPVQGDDVYIDKEIIRNAITNITENNVGQAGAFESLTYNGTPVETVVNDTKDTVTATLSVSETAVSEGAEDLIYTASLTDPSGALVTANNDVVIVTTLGEITIASGSSSGTLAIAVQENDTYFDDEVINNAIISVVEDNADAADSFEDLAFDDTKLKTLVSDTIETTTISLDNPTVKEGAEITITASVDNAPVDTPLVVTLDNGEAITIAVGDTIGSVTFANPNGDDAYVDGENLIYTIDSATGGNYEALNSDATSTVTVSDTKDTSTVTLSGNNVEEGTDITITATVNNAPEDSDLVLYLNNGEQITIAVGQTEGRVTFDNPNGEDVYVEHEDVTYKIIGSNDGGNYEKLAPFNPVTVEVIDTINNVYAQISVDQDSVFEGGVLTYTVNLIDENGDEVIVAADKEVTINLNWGGVADSTDIGELPTSIIINANSSEASFSVSTNVDSLSELSESLTVSISGLQDNDGVDEGFENLLVDTAQDSVTSTIFDAPTITAIDINGSNIDGQISVYDKGVGDNADDSETADGTLKVSAATGLISISIAGTEITLAQLNDLIANPQTVVITDHGEITLTNFTAITTTNGEDAVWEIDYTYELTDAQNHPEGEGVNDLLNTIQLTVEAENVAGVTSSVTGTGTLDVLVVDDIPIVTTTGTELNAIQVTESALGKPASANYSDAFMIDFGADGAAVSGSLEYSFEVTNSVSGLFDTETGDSINLVINEDGEIEGQLSTSGDVAFTITVDVNGEVKLEQSQLHTIQHSDSNSANDIATLANDSINLVATATDGDADSVSSTVAIGDHFSFVDQGPSIGDAPVATYVDEEHLDNGSDPSSERTTVSADLAVDFGSDGANTLTFTEDQTALSAWLDASDITLNINGDTITATRNDGNDPVFTVILNIDNEGQASYSFELQGAMQHLITDTHTLTFNYQATDGDNDSVTSTFVVNVTDDAPVAEDNDNYGTDIITGNVITDNVGTDDGLDVEGADTATVTEVSFDKTTYNVPIDGVSPLVIQATYGELTIYADGSYEYVRNDLTPGDVEEEFEYTLTDGDNDSDHATLTIGIENAVGTITNLTPEVNGGDTVVYENQLINGTDTNKPSAVTGTGDFTVSSPDGITELSIKHNNQTYQLVVNNLTTSLPITFTTALGNELSITGYQQGIVTYIYTLAENETHSDAGIDNLFESFEVYLEDMDDDITTSHLSVRIVDDIPVIEQTDQVIDLSVDETSIEDANDSGNTDTADLSVLFDINHGADGEALTNATSYQLAINAVSGLVDTATNSNVVLTINNDGTEVIGKVDGSGETVFTIVLDPETGEVSLTQVRSVKHADTDNANDAITLNSDAVTISATAIDGDDDEVISSVDIGDSFNFLDDGPSIEIATTGATLAELVTNDADLVTAENSSDTKDLSGAFAINTSSYGADGEGTTVWSYAIAFTDTATGLTSGGEAITLSQSGNIITGSANSRSVFTIEVNVQTGEVTLTQTAAIDHVQEQVNQADFSDDQQGLLADLITLTGTATITDGDDDSVNDSKTIEIGDQFTFTDDGPTIGNPATTDDGEVSEANLSTGSVGSGSVSDSGTLDITHVSADGINTIFNEDTIEALENLNLTSSYIPLEYSISDDGYTLTAFVLYSGGIQTIFTVDITDPNGAAAGYDFVLSGTLDHLKNGDDQYLDLVFPFTVVDDDSDTATDDFSIRVYDDGQGTIQAITVDEDSTSADAANTFNTSADATQANTTIVLEPIHGSTVLNPDGTITYVPDPDYSGRDIFSYETREADGDIFTTLVSVTVNPISDMPTFTVDDAIINTEEDTAITLGLNAPIVTDNTDQSPFNLDSPLLEDNELVLDSDNPELLGVITLTGIPQGVTLIAAKVTDSAEVNYISRGEAISVFISDGTHINGAEEEADLVMTLAQFEALQVIPAENDHTNFTVNVSVTSYEVDLSGDPIDGVAGAENSTEVLVYVEAVSDDAKLLFDKNQESGIPNIIGDVIYNAQATEANVTINEDTSFTLNSILSATFEDLDESEVRSITIENNTGEDILVDGVILSTGSSRTISAKANEDGQTGNIQSFDDITVGSTNNFSGDLEGILLTINAQDYDADGFNSINEGQNIEGITESILTNNSIALNLYVNPLADQVTIEDVNTKEDTAVLFLNTLQLSDIDEEVTGIVINKLPGGWTLSNADGIEVFIGNGLDHFTVPSNDVLDGGYQSYTITPPAHSSSDAIVSIEVETTDTQIVDGIEQVDRTENQVDINVVVTPVAEKLSDDGSSDFSDTDGDGIADLMMNDDHVYATAGLEDTWFDLGEDGIESPLAGWANQDADGSEATFALFTPISANGEADGAQFRYTTDNGATWVTQTYTGTAIEVPIDYLDTLAFKAPKNFSGIFEIQVKAYTVDTDPETGIQSEWTSSTYATLTNILILPDADVATTVVSQTVRGTEDEFMPLVIVPSSSDPSEEFNVTISGIPDGATISYNGKEYTDETPVKDLPEGITIVTDDNGTWSLKIEGFDPVAGESMGLKAPENSNDSFTLQVDTETVDTLLVAGDSNSPYVSTAEGDTLYTNVYPKGEADQIKLELAEDVTYIEAEVDSDGYIMLNAVVTGFTQVDNDGSEVLSFTISDLPDGFSIEGASRISDGVWSIAESQFSSVKLIVPENYNGDVEFTVAAVSTENDGDSLTESNTISLTITASPEASMKSSAVIDEDVSTLLSFAIETQNDDSDEILDAVWINIDSLEAATGISLTYGQNGMTLAEAALNNSVEVSEVDDGTDTWYVIEGDALTNIYALSAANVSDYEGQDSDGVDIPLTDFEIKYEIKDPGLNGGSDQTALTNDTYHIDIKPITDKPILAIVDTAIYDIKSNTINADNTGRLTIDLDIGNTGEDYDGSEELVSVVIEGLSEGVTIDGADYLGDGKWLMQEDMLDQIAEDYRLAVDFIVSARAVDSVLTITINTEDGDNDTLKEAVISDIDFKIGFVTVPGGDGPADIISWKSTDFNPTEDTPFKLSDAISGTISTEITDPNDPNHTIDVETDSAFNITIYNLPEGATVEGMTSSIVDGKEVWTLSGTGGDAELQAAMESIIITPPEDYNYTDDGEFEFNATLTTINTSSGAQKQVDEVFRDSTDVDVTPVTDDADLVITALSVDEGGSDPLTFTIDISNQADDPDWTLVDGKLYIQLDESGMPVSGGTLSYNGVVLSTTTVTGIEGITNGDYYIIEDADSDTDITLDYLPPEEGKYSSGSVSISATVQGQETGAGNIVTTTVSGAGDIAVSNSGYDFIVANVTGTENEFTQAQTDGSNIIQLDVTDNGLIDTDGSESLNNVLLTNIPNDFLIFTGDSANTATVASLATNAGGSEGTNSWLISTTEMPEYIGLMAPAYWSGTISDLQLIVNSGERGASSSLDSVQTFDLTVTAVADGITLSPTTSFGNEGEVIGLNLNLAMIDPVDVGSNDSSVETVTLQFNGLGEYAEFFVDGVSISAGDDTNVSYDASTGTYTITGLTENQVTDLGVLQSAAEFGTVQVRAQTVETDGGDTSDWTEFKNVTVNVTEQLATSADNSLLYDGNAINGLDGSDTINLRFGENLDFAADADGVLTNIEVINLGNEDYDHSLHNLSLADVQAMTGNSNTLAIEGDSGDNVTLLKDNNPFTSGWNLDDSDADYNIYTLTDLSDNSTLATVNVGKGVVTSIEEYQATTGDDVFVYDSSSIDGLDGSDTIQLRLGESASSDQLSSSLSNIEILDLSVTGENEITALSLADVLSMTNNDNILTINGDADDHVSLSSVNGTWTENVANSNENYTVYTSTDGSDTATLQIQTSIIID